MWSILKREKIVVEFDGMGQPEILVVKNYVGVLDIMFITMVLWA